MSPPGICHQDYLISVACEFGVTSNEAFSVFMIDFSAILLALMLVVTFYRYAYMRAEFRFSYADAMYICIIMYLSLSIVWNSAMLQDGSNFHWPLFCAMIAWTGFIINLTIIVLAMIMRDLDPENKHRSYFQAHRTLFITLMVAAPLDHCVLSMVVAILHAKDKIYISDNFSWVNLFHHAVFSCGFLFACCAWTLAMHAHKQLSATPVNLRSAVTEKILSRLKMLMKALPFCCAVMIISIICNAVYPHSILTQLRVETLAITMLSVLLAGTVMFMDSRGEARAIHDAKQISNTSFPTPSSGHSTPRTSSGYPVVPAASKNTPPQQQQQQQQQQHEKVPSIPEVAIEMQPVATESAAVAISSPASGREHDAAIEEEKV